MANAAALQHAVTHQLAIKDIFDGLAQREKLYAHHLARAAWHGSKIILRQTSAEGIGIFDFILMIHKTCGGRWDEIMDRCHVSRDELDAFLEYSGQFLSNLGNYYRKGDRKAVPNLSATALRKIGSISPEAGRALDDIIHPMLSMPPFKLDFPDDDNHSNYYPGEERITPEEINAVSKNMETHSLEPENTRIRKCRNGTEFSFEILQASAETDTSISHVDLDCFGVEIRLKRGDHAVELSKINAALQEALKYAVSTEHTNLLSSYIESFRTGSLDAYRQAQRIWVDDASPRVENIFGFVEPYRDPCGIRAEWQGFVGISDPHETRRLRTLVERSTEFIRTLPWAVPGENDGKGPFEANLFRAPDLSIVHSLAFCSSCIWEAVNLPNFSDIRESRGHKNIVFANRMSANNKPHRSCPYVHPTEVDDFVKCNHTIRFIVTALHELLGHGTGKLLTETAPGTYNFDRKHLPLNPLTGKAIETWYRPGQTWTSVFKKSATSVEECRAMLVSYYLADNKEILSIFDNNAKETLPADDCQWAPSFDVSDSNMIDTDEVTYYTYLHIGVEGIQALQSFNQSDQTWGQPHARANFAILKHLLLDGSSVLTVSDDPLAKTLHIRVDRAKIISHGKPSLGRMLCRLHVWRCIADVESCEEFYNRLSSVDGRYEDWRQIVAEEPELEWKFVQPNTLLRAGGDVDLRVYEENNEGIIQSFAERDI